MLDPLLKRIDTEIINRAIEAQNRPYDPATATFEAGRRQGVHQGLQVARTLVIEIMKGDEDDEAGHSGKAVRRFA